MTNRLTKDRRLKHKWDHFKRMRRSMFARESRHLANLIRKYKDGEVVTDRLSGRQTILTRKNKYTAELLRLAHTKLLQKVSRA